MVYTWSAAKSWAAQRDIAVEKKIWLDIFQILKYLISFKILKELIIDGYDQFLQDLKGNLIFQNLQSVDHKKKIQNLCFFIKLFFEYYLFSVLLRIKRAESPESQPDEPDFF